jgi:hypothetical protein
MNKMRPTEEEGITNVAPTFHRIIPENIKHSDNRCCKTQSRIIPTRCDWIIPTNRMRGSVFITLIQTYGAFST